MARHGSFGQGHEATDFRGLVLVLRARTGLLQRQLARAIGVTERTIQTWEAGSSYPSVERLKRLIEVCLVHGGFGAGLEREQARELWEAALREAPRFGVPFDRDWFAGLVARSAGVASAPVDPTTSRLLETPIAATAGVATPVLHGRAHELDTLAAWTLSDRSRLVGVLGVGGIGKTTLAAFLARRVAERFECAAWHSLRNGLPPSDWLADAIHSASSQQARVPHGDEARLDVLLTQLRRRRCLLVLDNFETVLEAGDRQPRYRSGFEAYGQILQLLGEQHHQSCVVVTSREKPLELALLEGEDSPVRVMRLDGLATSAVQRMLDDKRLVGDATTWTAFVERYAGNPLALKIVSESISELLGGDIEAFLSSAGPAFGSIRRLIDEQIARLSGLERSIAQWLAVEREAISFAQLLRDLEPNLSRNDALEALEGLRRRSLLEPGERRGSFTLQPVVLELVTDRLVEQVRNEVLHAKPSLLMSHALVKANARDFVRRAQERLIASAVLQPTGPTDQQLLDLLGSFRASTPDEHGYGPANVANLLRLSRGSLRHVDLSGLGLRQLYLQEVDMQGASLAGAHLVDCVLADAFEFPIPIVLSSDGALVAAGTAGGEIRIWRMADRAPVLSLKGHVGVVRGLAWAADGRRLASAGHDGTVKLWDATGGKLLASVTEHAGGAWCVALSADGRLLASGGADGEVALVNLDDPRAVFKVQVSPHIVRSVALSADGSVLALSGGGGLLEVWHDPPRGAKRALSILTGAMTTVALSADARVLAAGTLDGQLCVVDPATGNPVQRMLTQTSGVEALAVSSDGSRVLTGSADGTLQIWESTTGRLLTQRRAHASTIRGVALSSDAAIMASGAMDGTVKLWDKEDAQPLATFQGHSGGITSVATPGGGRLVSGGHDGVLTWWDVATGRVLASADAHTGGVRSVAAALDRQVIASGGADGNVKLWHDVDGPTGTILGSHAGPVWCVALASGGHVVASSGLGGDVKLWDVAGTRLIATLPRISGAVVGLALSADARMVATGGSDGTVRVWDAARAEVVTTYDHTGPVSAVALSADAHLLVSGAGDGTLRLWDLTSGRLLAALPGHLGPVRALALRQDGRLLASAGNDGIVRLWEVPDGRQRAQLRGHTAAVQSLAMISDGSLLVSGSTDGTVRLWQIEDGSTVRTLRRDRRYERMNIEGLTGVTHTQRLALIALGAVE